jgi:hypothetical protein
MPVSLDQRVSEIENRAADAAPADAPPLPGVIIEIYH